jgi:hypothetical protein
MRRSSTPRLFGRLAVFALLLGCLTLSAPTPPPTVRAMAGCSTCDTNYQTCGQPVLQAYEECMDSGQHSASYCEGMRDFQLSHCRTQYEMCLSSCTPDGGGTGGGAAAVVEGAPPVN